MDNNLIEQTFPMMNQVGIGIRNDCQFGGKGCNCRHKTEKNQSHMINRDR